MEIKDKISKIISSNNVCLFMKGTPENPQCGFSMTVSNILKHLKVNFKSITSNNYKASKEDLLYFKYQFENILFKEDFFDIFNLKKIKNFIIEIS